MAISLSRGASCSAAGGGFGLIGLAGLLDDEGLLEHAARAGDAATRPGALADGAPRPRTSPARAKRVIWIFVNGGPSQVDTWDYKPALAAGTASR